jgi:ABC-type nitrate/sulfonate/bicarbonate transport system substrate-binding protein
VDTAAERELRVIVFPGAFNWPIWIAQAKGFFKRHNLAVAITPTPNSVYQLTHLIAGGFEIAHTALDNLVAYVEGQTQVPVPGKPDLIAFMGGDNGLLRLVTKPGIRSYTDLRGKQLSVDALTTGYAFVLKRILEDNGLREDDYELVSVGGGIERWQALQNEGGPVGTLLMTPFELLAKDKGFTLLSDVSRELGRYQGLIGAANRAWAAAHADELTGYIRAYLAALAWLYDPANRDEALGLLTSNSNIPAELAGQVYDVLVDPTQGIAPAATLDVTGIETVLSLRHRYSSSAMKSANPARYFDLSYYNKARDVI